MLVFAEGGETVPGFGVVGGGGGLVPFFPVYPGQPVLFLWGFRLGETLTFNKPAKPLQSFDTCLPTAHARKQKSHCIALRAETKIGPQNFAKTRGFATTTSKIGSFFQLPKYAFRLGETLTFNKK